MQITAVLCVRNEGAFLLDWLAHHMACGITHVVALSNDCDDGTDAMLDRLASLGHVTHIRNDGPYGTGGIQFTGLKLADEAEAVRAADWLLPIDIDEFVNVHVGDRTLPALIAALPQADAITLTWRLFGNAGVLRHEDRPIPELFTRAAPRAMGWPWRAAMFKTLYRNTGAYGKLGVHRPRAPEPARADAARWFDGEGRELPPRYRRKGIFSHYGHSNHGLVQLNHYPLGSMENYVLKSARGRAVHSGDRLGLDYWVERNLNQEEDPSILGLSPAVRPLRAAFGRDEALARLHAGAVRWRQERFAQLMLDEQSRSLMGRLMMTPPSRPLSPEAAAALQAHARAALQVAPEDD